MLTPEKFIKAFIHDVAGVVRGMSENVDRMIAIMLNGSEWFQTHSLLLRGIRFSCCR